MVYLQNKAVENHVIILNLYKKFYNYIIFIQKNSSDSKNFNFDKLFKNLSYLKHETFNIYQEIIEKYPDEKVHEYIFIINFFIYLNYIKALKILIPNF